MVGGGVCYGQEGGDFLGCTISGNSAKVYGTVAVGFRWTTFTVCLGGGVYYVEDGGNFHGCNISENWALVDGAFSFCVFMLPMLTVSVGGGVFYTVEGGNFSSCNISGNYALLNGITCHGISINGLTGWVRWRCVLQHELWNLCWLQHQCKLGLAIW